MANTSAEAFNSLETGDILLYRTKDLGATFNAVVQGSKFSHVSVVVREREGDEESPFQELYPDDYKQYKTNLALFEAVPKRGVTLFPLEARLIRTVDTIKHLSVRRHCGLVSDEGYAQLLEFMKKVSGRKLETLTSDMTRALLFHRLGLGKGNKEEDWEKFYCSELVAESLQQLGIVREGGLNSNDLIPDSFAQPSGGQNKSFNFAERITNSGHSYGAQEILIEKGSPLRKELKGIKEEMKRKYKEEQHQQKS